MNNGNIDVNELAIKEIAIWYQVSRTLKVNFEEHARNNIRGHLHENQAIIQGVNHLADALGRLDGSHRRPLSAASKFLYFFHPLNTIVFDNNSRLAAEKIVRHNGLVRANGLSKSINNKYINHCNNFNIIYNTIDMNSPKILCDANHAERGYLCIVDYISGVDIILNMFKYMRTYLEETMGYLATSQWTPEDIDLFSRRRLLDFFLYRGGVVG